MPHPKTIIAFIICILVPQLAGLIGALFTTPAIPTWYSTLVKSPLNPPSWVFAPVWTTLFLMMGVAAFLVWRAGAGFPPSARNLRGNDTKGKGNETKKRVYIALGIFGVQLVLNTLWSILFFGLQNPGAALVEIIFLWLAIIATIIAFYCVSKPASYLLIPYILWVSFAAVLNFSIWNLNKTTPNGGVACTMEAKLCADGSAVGRTGPNCEFAPCPDLKPPLMKGGSRGISLPVGYSLDSYKVAEVLNVSCTKNSDCQLPMEYAVRSNCPYVAPCLENKCTVVCPEYK